jgi:hypothetical protein
MLDEEDVQIHAIGIHDHMASPEETLAAPGYLRIWRG